MVEQITDNGLIIAIIVRAGFKKNGIEFFTPPELSQQMGYMNRPKGYKIEPHTHKKVNKSMTITHEVLYIKSGEIKVLFYGNDHSFLEETNLLSGDIILLVTGGHSIEMVKDSELIEIKQGPYSDDDKINFIPVKRNDE